MTPKTRPTRPYPGLDFQILFLKFIWDLVLIILCILCPAHSILKVLSKEVSTLGYRLNVDGFFDCG